MQEPSKESNGSHIIETKHLDTHFICDLIEFFLGLIIGDGLILELHHPLLDKYLNGLLHTFSG
jgi:hypothetical protein